MANAIEDLKKRVDGLDVWEHILEASKVGYKAVDPELVPLFKWYGVYAQKPNAEGYFMMRVKIPGGQLSPVQLEKLFDLKEKYARGVIDITTRQAVQMHWLKIEDIPTIVNELQSVGMDVAGGCGDIARNITGCSLAGLTKDEFFDATDELIAIDEAHTRNRDFSNLPRKYKMSITGCADWCSQPDINCASLVGVKHPETGEPGYALKVGGGLSTKPMIAKNFPVFIKREDAKAVMLAVTTVYRDNGFRDKRHKARIKFLIEDWGVEKFLEELEKLLGKKLDRVEKIRTMETGADEYYPSPKTSHNDHLGVTELKNGNYAVGLAFISGRSSADEFKNIAKLIRDFAPEGGARTTNKQNMIIVNVLADKLNALITEANLMGLKVEHSAFTRLGVACTGTEFCNLAIVETKVRAKKLFDYLDAEFPGMQEQVMVSVTGCPNNCAQYSVADIGIVGCKVKVKNDSGIEEPQDAFRVFLGGRLGDEAQFGQALDGRYLHDDIHHTLKEIFAYYNEAKKDAEAFRHFVDRVSLSAIQEKVLAYKN